MSVRFDIRRADASKVSEIQRAYELPRFVAHIMVSRGIATVEEAQAFLHPSLEESWCNPYDIPGLSEVADFLQQALYDNLHIVVFGDFDLDGISSTTVLTRGLRELGGRVTPFIPRRFEEGYGITEEAIARMEQLSPAPQAIVSVDCGISCRDTVNILRNRGYRVAITDHHEPGELVPEGVPVADPKLDSTCQSSILAGVGVALKLVHALGARMGKPHLWREFTDFAALGTIADLMPMRDENRALVADGLARINKNPRPCLAALLTAVGANDKEVTSTNLSFSIIPRLNAAGRMGDAMLSLELLLTDDFMQASALAAKLEEMNMLRRAIEAELSTDALTQAEKMYHGQRALVVAGEGWHEGVKGIVASRLANKYGVPVILFSIENGEARGSGRSVGSVNLFKAVESTSDILTRFGGHEAAVGVTLPAELLDEFWRRLCVFMDSLSPDAFHPAIRVDAVVELGELTLHDVAQLDVLAPFGQENPIPCFLAPNVMLHNARAVGVDKNHFSCSLTDGCSSVAGIMFHCNQIDELLATDSVVCAAFEANVEEYRGRKSVKAMLKTVAPAYTCKALEACVDESAQDFLTMLQRVDEDDMRAARQDVSPQSEVHEEARRQRRQKWEKFAAAHPAELRDEVIRALIGDASLHAGQRAILDYLAQGESVLSIMATGRGKSLTFQVHATLVALLMHAPSIFVYPLRALIADQAFYLSESLREFGIVSEVLTGESLPEKRAQIMQGLAEHAVDIVLTTPEYLEFHAEEFAAAATFAFAVIDEAHHIGQAHAGNREAYARMGSILNTLGNPCVLACTATAGDEFTNEICSALPITQVVLDDTARDNLLLDDQRNIKNRDAYLARIIARGEKTIIYVNSREQTVTLARLLRKMVPQLALFIGFYNAGLSRSERQRVENLFRDGVISVLVTTSAFGEGVNIPDVRHVVLYHLPFSDVEFNQMSGRAGRDGQPAVIHLLYNRNDAASCETMLGAGAPSRDVLVAVYRALRAAQQQAGAASFAITADDLARKSALPNARLNEESALCGLRVFKELGLIELSKGFSNNAAHYTVRVIPDAAHVELTSSVRYREGIDACELFRTFQSWAFNEPTGNLRVHIIHPMMPGSAFRFDKDR